MNLTFEKKKLCMTVRFGPVTIVAFTFQGAACTTNPIEITEIPQVIEDGGEAVVFGSVPDAFLPSRRLFIRDGRFYYSPSRFPRYMVDLSMSYEQYLQQLGSKERSTIRRKVQKFLSRTKDCDAFREYKTPAELIEFHSIARELSRRTYQEKVLGKGLPDTHGFRAEMLSLAASDNVRAFTLHLDQKPIAYLYSPARAGILYYDFLGYDPDYSSQSPGSVLQWLAFERIFREGRFRYYDFEEGEGQHKKTFATKMLDCGNLLIFTISAKSFLYIVFDLLFLSLTRTAIKMSDIFKIRTLVRKAYRK